MTALQPDICSNWLCPDLRCYWQLTQQRDSQQVTLRSPQTAQKYSFSLTEGFALQHFVGEFTVAQVQSRCDKKFGDRISETFVQDLLQRLLDLRILSQDSAPQDSAPQDNSPRLKECVQWIYHPDGYWILRNPEDVTFLQVSDRDKMALSLLNERSPKAILDTTEISSAELKNLLKLLAATGMLVGTHPPKPPRKKFTPLSLMFMKLRLFNPDPFLSRAIASLHWIWTKPVWLFLCAWLSLTTIFALHHRADLLLTAQQFMSFLNLWLILGFGCLSLLVIALHELSHALTLKHYGGIVPDMGLMFMVLMPIAYTNTTDQYSLPSRRQRGFVVGAGVLCQLMIAACAFWTWFFAATGSWLWIVSFLLFAASIFTVAINLNPLARFDGYYLAVALTGINNLRQRSFQFYRDLLTFRPSSEKRDRWILAIYAPFSFLYILSIFGFLFLRIANWILTYLPFTVLILFLLWGIYFMVAPDPKPHSS